MHQLSEPPILYFGTPVVLITTSNTDGTYNIAPISSIFWLGWRAIIGISAFSKTTENIRRTGECALNLPSVYQAAAVNRLALTTGTFPVPIGKAQKGYTYEAKKFDLAQLTPIQSETVSAPRVAECPVQMEAVMENLHGIAEDEEKQRGRLVTIELRIQRVYLDELILMEGNSNRVDPNKWRPLIMSFQQFYGLGEQVHVSTLSSISEDLYRSPDVERAKNFTKLVKPT
ncbi:flavin reductase (DIM6/NTAB) family NADH-FMN oxidoreductase RutF [Chitinophaga niastensis]|uniref:Flavin reductase (DIM6/NTAB) family NADH-FMN oxidoreductase RutF n=1 Tax=Chitinophaga niastensis TaxID=536980 RepID=A0A2P8HCU5_CHINA|nr:flavin reductase family protein [Chitinophaga niastensis]PSL43941.1 flavin reductase (DIM6/NTAB) family NADH-FMN oxidoreductase RutF [Chitinophaga niastensis]